MKIMAAMPTLRRVFHCHCRDGIQAEITLWRLPERCADKIEKTESRE
jgi:hypothetical protein